MEETKKENNSKIRSSVKKAWAGTIEETLKDIDTKWYEKPDNVIALPLNAINGKPATTNENIALFYYVTGSEPTHNEAEYVNKNIE